MEICIDFDGTCTTHDFPKVGEDIGAIPVLKALVDQGHKLILFTMRSDEKLDDAVQWFRSNGIELYGVNENPTQRKWTNSPKAYGQLYIDDAALGIPLIFDEKSTRPYVNWKEIRLMLIVMGVLEK